MDKGENNEIRMASCDETYAGKVRRLCSPLLAPESMVVLGIVVEAERIDSYMEI